MTRCHNEPEHPESGFAWTDPDAFPAPIQTPRLVVRPYTLDDTQPLFDTINATRDSLLPWLPWARTEHTSLAATTKFVADQTLRATKPLTNDGIVLGIFDRSTHTLLGGTGLHDLRRDTASCEIGYWMRHDQRNQGLTTEAVAHWISAIFTPQPQGGLGLNRVRVFCSADNTASTRVPEKLNLPNELHQRADYFVPHHAVTDRLGWGVLASEWDTVNHRMMSPPATPTA